ncbi:tetraspanin-1-like [Mya arenaria]|uniref:tetraspanin-1-like n=1 Tax=Mya arenaria TaxID=6604 RepID=UPI0022E4907C|nr:tetraspanin-1-like [Mya arenaria]
MGCLQTLCRVFLIVVNLFFLLLGLALFAAGLFVRFGSEVLNEYVDTVKAELEKSASTAGLGTVDLSGLNLSDMLFGVALGLIFFGIFLIVISVLGTCGSCCKLKILLVTYVVICSLILVVQIIIVGILYGSPDTFHDPAKKTLKDKIQTDYAGLAGSDVISMAWNVVMQQVGCCGANSYADFTGAENWETDYSSTGSGYTLKTPIACCRTLPDSNDLTCADISGATTANNYLEEGCYNKVWEQTLGNTTIVVASLVGIGVFQLALIVFAVIILCTMREKTGHKD